MKVIFFAAMLTLVADSDQIKEKYPDLFKCLETQTECSGVIEPQDLERLLPGFAPLKKDIFVPQKQKPFVGCKETHLVKVCGA